MKKKFIGIDVSKDTLDVCILAETQQTFVIKNNKREILKFFNSNINPEIEHHVCLENTGKYSWLLVELLPEFDCSFYVVNPLHLKRSMGLTRGKNDKIDAIRIAKFIKKNHGETEPHIPLREELLKMKILLTERRYKMEVKKQLTTKNKENKIIHQKEISKEMTKLNNRLIREINKQIKKIESDIRLIIKNDDNLLKLQKILKSVPGIGDILCWNLIVKTNEFKMIKTPRKLACYAGVAPFSSTSGTSIFGRNRVSLYADKQLKKLLHMGAMSSIRLDNDFKKYYVRKVEEGKNKMSVLNAVRNKIIHVIYALIKNQTFFQNRLVMS